MTVPKEFTEFTHDVFLSHSAKDKAIVRAVAERLRADGLRVWLDDWEIKPGASIPAKIEDGLEHSRVLVLCISAHAPGSDWAQLACPAVASEQRRKAGRFRFREPPDAGGASRAADKGKACVQERPLHTRASWAIKHPCNTEFA
ncbi:MAG: toll/interleukin-1 receptor domain-containing protein [Candidatus Binatia bacterium]